MKIIFVVACDLARDSNNLIVVGPETKTACDRALSLAKAYPISAVRIVVTAGVAGGEWNNTHMAHVMAKYMLEQAPEIPLMIGRAKRFNTSSEMEILAKIASGRTQIDEIILTVKWWHAPRSWLLCKYWLWRSKLNIPVSVSPCPSQASWISISKELLFAWPKNIIRLILMGR